MSRLLGLIRIAASIQVYADGMAKESYLSADDLEAMFCNFPSILNACTTFVRRLHDYRSAPSSSRPQLGQVLAPLSSNLKIFKPYCRNYYSAIETISRLLEKHKKFADFLSQCHSLADQPLGALLIMPIQRVMRYPMLVSAIIKDIPESHPEYGGLYTAYNLFRKFAVLIDRDQVRAKQSSEVDRAAEQIEGCPELVSCFLNYCKWLSAVLLHY